MYRRLNAESLRLDGQENQLLSGPQRLLRKLANQKDPRDLTTLWSTVEPYSFHDRAHAQQNTTDTPMNGFVDAAVYDPPLRHEVELLMRQYLQGQGTVQLDADIHLKELFESWRTAGDALAADQQPGLQALHSRAVQLSELGKTGLTAMQARETHQRLTESQASAADTAMKAATSGDSSMVRFIVLGPVQELLAQVEPR